MEASGKRGFVLYARCFLITVAILSFNPKDCFSQDHAPKTRIVTGLAGPELIHAGITHRLAAYSQLGFSAGIGPSFGTTWSALSLEHRFYFGRESQASGLRQWFFRQGTTYFPPADRSKNFTLNLTIGKDLSFRNVRNGVTIDLGAFYLPDSEESSVVLVRKWNLWPALRFQLYFSL